MSYNVNENWMIKIYIICHGSIFGMLPSLFSLTFVFIMSSVLFLFSITSTATTMFAIPTDRSTLLINDWAIQKLSNDVYGITSDFSGNIYFVEHNGNKIGRLAPDDNSITEWIIPTNSSGPTGLASDPFSGKHILCRT